MAKQLFFLFFFISSYSQTIIKGFVRDKDSEPLFFSSVTLRLENSKSIISFCQTDEKGYYQLETNRVGNFILSLSSLNYTTISIPIELLNNQTIEKNVILTYNPIELKEVIIESKKTLTVKKDTIVFNAKSFSNGSEQVVEDLLKKIPGLTITSNGTIKVGNQEIEKIMIEGDDFFEKGYKLLSKNMPANEINKVEIYQNYSNNKHLKDIENSDKVALNLKLNDNAKRQWFGNMSLGHGLISEDRYEIKCNLMNFGKKNKYYFITNANNTGLDATGEIENLINPYNSDNIPSIGDNQTTYSLLGLNVDVLNFKPGRVNLNNDQMQSLNSIFTLSPKVKLKTLGFFNANENNYLRNTFQSYVIGTDSFENNEIFKGKKNKSTSFCKLNLLYDITKTKTFEYTVKFNSTSEKNKSDLTFNNDLLNEKLQSNNQLFDQKVVYTNKFKTNKVLLLTARYIDEKTPQTYQSNQFIFQNLFNDNANNIQQTSQNKMKFAGFEAHFLDRKKNNDLLEINFGNQFRSDILKSNFSLKSNEIIINVPDNYQNQQVYSTNDLYLNSKYRFKFKNFSLLTQADFHKLFNNLESLENSKNQNAFYINPKIGFEWQINNKNKLKSSYSLSKTNSSILEVYKNYILTNFRSFEKGTDNFNQLEANSFLLNYTFGNWGDRFFANTFILFSNNHAFFSTNTFVTQNYEQIEKIIIKDRKFFTFSSNIDRYFKSISSNLKVNFGGSISNYKNIINNSDFREVKSNTVNYGFELRSGFRGFFNYHLGIKWDYKEIKTTLTNSFTDNLTFIDLSFKMNTKLNVIIQTERYYFANLGKQNNKYYFVDLEARFNTKKNKLIYSILGNNLLNTKTFRNYSINDISSTKTEYQLQTRYLLFKIEYKF